MNCTRYRTPIQEQVDGTLGAIRRAELEQHLDECDGVPRAAGGSRADPRRGGDCRRCRRPMARGCRLPAGCARKGASAPMRRRRAGCAPAALAVAGDRGGARPRGGCRRDAAHSARTRRRRRRPRHRAGARRPARDAVGRSRATQSSGAGAVREGDRATSRRWRRPTSRRSIRGPRRRSRRTSGSSTRRSRKTARR